MEPDVIRMYSSSPPPMEDAAEEEDDEFGDFGTFSGVPNSVSFTEFDTPTTFNQTQALTATSPPELINRGVIGFSHSNSNGNHKPNNELSKANGVVPVSRLGSSLSDRTEMKQVISSSLDFSGGGGSGSQQTDCNGGGTEVLTNGFDDQGSPSSQNSVHSHKKVTSSEETGSAPVCSPQDDFADFAAFSAAERNLSQMANQDLDCSTGSRWLAEAAPQDQHCTVEQGLTSEDKVRDTNRTGSDRSASDSISVPAKAPDGGPHTDTDSPQRDGASAAERFIFTKQPLTLNRVDVADRDDFKDVASGSDSDLSPDVAGESEAGQSDEKGSENETETETSFGRPLSTDALEEYGDMSTTGSVPSPPLQGETATPVDHSQMVEDEEDFGDFGDVGVFSGQGFADFEQQEQSRSHDSAPTQELLNAEEEDDFGDFNSPKFHSCEGEGSNRGRFADFPVSDSFGNFTSAVEGVDGEQDAGWSAFGEQQQVEGESWAAFNTEQRDALPAESREGEGGEEAEEAKAEEEVEEEEEQWHATEAPAVSKEAIRMDRQTPSLSSRLEKLFHSSFPPAAAPPVEDQVLALRILLEPSQDGPGAEDKRWGRGGVWPQLQDIHEAVGLRHQWGGSHCNKALLCCLGIDTRNILFTGQKKQPVIVPMYAASLGMLEPTKEPVKPVSAAEMIASIAQNPPGAPEKNTCPPDTGQETLPPVQFDWSSSGLTNPLDGVDPELYELTTAKLDSGSSGNRVADAFARLMSTMEKTSTSTRKPRKEENLSEEASKVIAGLPDLSFMQAKVLMFPATLTPLSCQAPSD
uniref:Aftiphilin a n=1 Tax=Echeneis naucrates TaxID=173247 RepID=A0A665T294_ECHNA